MPRENIDLRARLQDRATRGIQDIQRRLESLDDAGAIEIRVQNLEQVQGDIERIESLASGITVDVDVSRAESAIGDLSTRLEQGMQAEVDLDITQALQRVSRLEAAIERAARQQVVLRAAGGGIPGITAAPAGAGQPTGAPPLPAGVQPPPFAQALQGVRPVAAGFVPAGGVQRLNINPAAEGLLGPGPNLLQTIAALRQFSPFAGAGEIPEAEGFSEEELAAALDPDNPDAVRAELFTFGSLAALAGLSAGARGIGAAARRFGPGLIRRFGGTRAGQRFAGTRAGQFFGRNFESFRQPTFFDQATRGFGAFGIDPRAEGIRLGIRGLGFLGRRGFRAARSSRFGQRAEGAFNRNRFVRYLRDINFLDPLPTRFDRFRQFAETGFGQTVIGGGLTGASVIGGALLLQDDEDETSLGPADVETQQRNFDAVVQRLGVDPSVAQQIVTQIDDDLNVGRAVALRFATIALQTRNAEFISRAPEIYQFLRSRIRIQGIEEQGPDAVLDRVTQAVFEEGGLLNLSNLGIPESVLAPEVIEGQARQRLGLRPGQEIPRTQQGFQAILDAQTRALTRLALSRTGRESIQAAEPELRRRIEAARDTGREAQEAIFQYLNALFEVEQAQTGAAPGTTRPLQPSVEAEGILDPSEVPGQAPISQPSPVRPPRPFRARRPALSFGTGEVAPLQLPQATPTRRPTTAQEQALEQQVFPAGRPGPTLTPEDIVGPEGARAAQLDALVNQFETALQRAQAQAEEFPLTEGRFPTRAQRFEEIRRRFGDEYGQLTDQQLQALFEFQPQLRADALGVIEQGLEEQRRAAEQRQQANERRQQRIEREFLADVPFLPSGFGAALSPLESGDFRQQLDSLGADLVDPRRQGLQPSGFGALLPRVTGAQFRQELQGLGRRGRQGDFPLEPQNFGEAFAGALGGQFSAGLFGLENIGQIFTQGGLGTFVGGAVGARLVELGQDQLDALLNNIAPNIRGIFLNTSQPDDSAELDLVPGLTPSSPAVPQETPEDIQRRTGFTPEQGQQFLDNMDAIATALRALQSGQTTVVNVEVDADGIAEVAVDKTQQQMIDGQFIVPSRAVETA